jgi:hypothetical protein
MVNQIFKSDIKNVDLFKLLDLICSKNEKHYVVNNAAYKRGLFNGEIMIFVDLCKPYYHVSKRYYLERKMSYNSFITILRQICKHNNITYTTQTSYDKSSYDIVYYIYICSTKASV